jgi:deoxyribonuclease V
LEDLIVNLKEFQRKQAKQIILKDYHEQYSNACILSVIDKTDLLTGGGLIYFLDNQNIESVYIHKTIPAPHPYIPGGLSLRYKALLSKILEGMKQKFDLIIIFPGAGIQHPMLFGLASEIGLETAKPSIGITKNALVGSIDDQSKSIDFQNVISYDVKFKENKVAKFLKVQNNINGIFVSPGHLISVEMAGSIIAKNLEYRLPSPVRYLRELLQKQI